MGGRVTPTMPATEQLQVLAGRPGRCCRQRHWRSTCTAAGAAAAGRRRRAACRPPPAAAHLGANAAVPLLHRLAAGHHARLYTQPLHGTCGAGHKRGAVVSARPSRSTPHALAPGGRQALSPLRLVAAAGCAAGARLLERARPQKVGIAARAAMTGCCSTPHRSETSRRRWLALAGLHEHAPRVASLRLTGAACRSWRPFLTCSHPRTLAALSRGLQSQLARVQLPAPPFGMPTAVLSLSLQPPHLHRPGASSQCCPRRKYMIRPTSTHMHE